MLLPILTLVTSLAPRNAEPEHCDYGPACDRRDSDRVADPDYHDGAYSLTNLPEVFSTENYPIEAVRLEQEGVVTAKLHISPEGKPLSCIVTRTSGAPSLDTATCDRLMRVGKFKIARGKSGRSKAYKSTIRVAWTLPTTLPFMDQRTLMLFSIDAAGKVGQCRQEFSDSPAAACPADAIPMAKQIIAAAPNPEIIASQELVLEQGFLIGEHDPFSRIGKLRGERAIGLTAVQLAIDADGKVSECAGIADAVPALADEMCDALRDERFKPINRYDFDRQRRRAIAYAASYLRPLGN